jgi:regulator of sigma E protease
LLALVIFWVAFMIGPPVRQVTIPAVMVGSPAEAAGIQSGDVIVQVNGRVVDDNSTIVVEEVSGSAGVPVEFLLLRNGEQISLSVTPRSPGEYDAEEDGPTGIQLALESTGENISVGPVRSLVRSVETIYDIIARTLQAPVMLIRGEISGDEARPVSVVGISQLAGLAAEETAVNQDLFPILWFTGIISVALGFTNLLPIPALDGGRIMFVLIEAVRGRRIEPEREGMVHLVGMLVLLGLMVLIIIQDIVNPIIPF